MQDHPEQIVSTLADLEAVKPGIGTVTIARPVPYEWVQPESEKDLLSETRSILMRARELLPISEAALVAYPGTMERVVKHFWT